MPDPQFDIPDDYSTASSDPGWDDTTALEDGQDHVSDESLDDERLGDEPETGASEESALEGFATLGNEPASDPTEPGSLAGAPVTVEGLGRAKSFWWLPDGYHLFLAEWSHDDWTRFLGFEDFRDVQAFALRGLDILGRGAETHNVLPLQQVQIAMSVPYVRTNVFAREGPGREKDWVQRVFEMYASEFNVNHLKAEEVLKLPEEVSQPVSWQVAPTLRRLREQAAQAAAILKHALRTLEHFDKLEPLQRNVLGLGFLALTDLFCAPELLQYVLQREDALARDFPRMRELPAHIQAYRRNMPVSFQVMLGTTAVLSEEFSGDLRVFSETGADPALCYDRLREVKALVDVAVDLTQFALPDLVERTLREHIDQPVRQLVREGATLSVRRAAGRLLAGSQALLEAARDGQRLGNLLHHPWKAWADQVLAAMRAALRAQDALEKQVLEQAKDPVKNLKALQELAVQLDNFESSETCQALAALLRQEAQVRAARPPVAPTAEAPKPAVPPTSSAQPTPPAQPTPHSPGKPALVTVSPSPEPAPKGLPAAGDAARGPSEAGAAHAPEGEASTRAAPLAASAEAGVADVASAPESSQDDHGQHTEDGDADTASDEPADRTDAPRGRRRRRRGRGQGSRAPESAEGPAPQASPTPPGAVDA